MVDLSEIQVAYYMVAATGVLVAAIYYVMNMKSGNKTRQAQLYMQVYSLLLSREMCEADLDLANTELTSFDDFKRLMEDKEKYSSYMMWGQYFEGIGVLVREGLLDIRLVALLNSGPIMWFWEKYRRTILDTREKTGHRRALVELEYLYERVKQYGRDHPELGIATVNMSGVELRAASG